jgi:indole-3-glycerol phosphate synthase
MKSPKPMQVIAEVKTHSPFGWTSPHSWDYLFELACRVGDYVAIHTDPRWGGSMDLVRRARSMTDKLILAKGIHRTDDEVREALDAGADFVLVVGRVPNIELTKVYLEPTTLKELWRLPKRAHAVWNARNVWTGERKYETFGEARMLHQGWLCQASFIKSWEDVDRRANAILVGTHLPEFALSLKIPFPLLLDG